MSENFRGKFHIKCNHIFCTFALYFKTMYTITFDENINLSKRHFKNLEEFQMELADENPDNFLTLDELKRSIKRKNV